MKSFVTLEQNVCVVCGATYDTGSLLLDKRLKDTFEHHTVTGWGMCDEHHKMIADGFIHLVVVANPPDHRDRIDPNDADRTGEVLHMKRDVASHLFNCEMGDMQFIEQGVADLIKDRYTAEVGEQPQEITA